MNVRAAVCLSLCVVMIPAVASWADEGPPDPISLDWWSPSVVGFGSTPGNIYDMLPVGGAGYDVGGPGPIVHLWEQTYGLVPMADNNDAHSNGEVFPPNQMMSIYFSGDDMSIGLPGTDYNHQAQRMQAAGDRFVANGMTTIPPTLVMGGAGPSGIAGPVYSGGLNNWPVNLLSANQHRYNEIPSIGPALFNGYLPPPGATPMDDMDALELTPFDGDGDGLHDWFIYFSLDITSPTLNAFGASPADILVAPPTLPVQRVYAWSWWMGLTPGDDIDALTVWDLNVPGQVDLGFDYALFSLAPGSPYLFGLDGVPGSADDWSAADIFVTDFTNSNTLYLKHTTLGMQFDDNIDALDVEAFGYVQEPLDSVAIAGDYNRDGVTDAADYTVWRDNLGMVGPPGIRGDGDNGSGMGIPDGVVDEFDYIWWKVNFAPVVPGSGSTLAAVPEPNSLALVIAAAVLWGATAAARMRRR